MRRSRLQIGLLTLPLLLGACSFLAGDKVEQGPLSKNSEAKHFGFAKLPPLANKGADAIRVLVQPSFGRYDYRFDFLPLDAGCKVVDDDIDDPNKDNWKGYCGNVRVDGYRTDAEDPDTVTSFQFIVPAEDYRTFYESLRYRMNRWTGSYSMVLDGTSIGVELHSRGKVSSINSNIGFHTAQDSPSAFAGLFVKALALSFGPTGMFPRGNGWHVFKASEYPCADAGLNEPDADGFGVGDDACAKWLTSQPKQK